jgi:hypothetical protein
MTQPSAPRRQRPTTTSGKRPASSPGPWRRSGSIGWPHSVADAQQRARDPATQAVIEKSRQPPDPGRDAIRPVYPLEALLPGLGAKRLADAARVLGGVMLRQALPESRPLAGNAAANAAKPESTAGNTSKQAEPMPSSRPVRLDDGQQDKHIEGTNNHIPSRSTLIANPRALLQQFAGRGKQVGQSQSGKPAQKRCSTRANSLGYIVIRLGYQLRRHEG